MIVTYTQLKNHTWVNNNSNLQGIVTPQDTVGYTWIRDKQMYGQPRKWPEEAQSLESDGRKGLFMFLYVKLRSHHASFLHQH